MNNINVVIQDALKEINFEEIAKNAAISKVKEAVESQVKDQLKSYSGFGQKLNDHLKEQLTFDLSSIQLPQYREWLMDQISDSLAQFTTAEHAAEIRKFINEKVIGESRDEIDCITFMDELTEMIKESCDEEDDEKYKIEFIQEERSYSSAKYWSLKISTKNESSYRKESLNEVLYAAFSDGKIYHMRGERFELKEIYCWFKAIYFRKTKIIDIESYDLNVPYRD